MVSFIFLGENERHCIYTFYRRLMYIIQAGSYNNCYPPFTKKDAMTLRFEPTD